MARYTKQILTQALRKLLREKKVNDITVQDLVDEAQVNRKTFYYHYHTMSDLLNEMCSDKVEEILEGEEISPENWEECTKKLLYFAIEEKREMRAIFSSVYATEYNNHLQSMLEDKINEFVANAKKTYEARYDTTVLLTEEQTAYIQEYYSMAFYGMFKIWFMRGMKDSPENVCHNLSLLTNENVFETFQKMDAENRQKDAVSV